jgi:hypothetical protein
MSRAVGRRSFNSEARVQTQASPCGISNEPSVNGTGSCPSTYVFSCQKLSNSGPYSFIHHLARLVTLKTDSCTTFFYITP